MIASENDISGLIVNASYEIHRQIGPGLLESAYEAMLGFELQALGLHIERQKPISIIYKGIKLDIGFRADIIVENKVIIEIKSVESLAAVHFKQLLTYLKLTNIKVGLLTNFNENLLKTGIRRIVNNL